MESNTPRYPDADIQQAKGVMRARVRAEIDKMSPTDRAAASFKACALLERQRIWMDARGILFYAPMPVEPDIWRLVIDSLAAGKTVALPRYVPEQKSYVACQITESVQAIGPGQYGVREPRDTCPIIPLNRLDFALVPGIAFDLNGYRLGRGKGYYDRLLAMFEGPACGVAFDQQIVERIPVEPHDVRLNCILTPTRWHVSGPRPVLK